jgi:hypothetical protein
MIVLALANRFAAWLRSAPHVTSVSIALIMMAMLRAASSALCCA